MANDKDFKVKNDLNVGGDVTVNGTVDGRDIATDGTKLDTIETNAKDDQSITAGSGLTGGGTGDVTLNVGAGTGITVNANDIAIGQPVDSSADVTFSTLTTTGNIIVGGNLQVSGTTTTIDTQELHVTDNMIYMADGYADSAGAPTASVDIGFAAGVNDNGSYEHVGFFRDATDDRFKVFKGYTPEPDAAVEINTGHASFSLADLQAATFYGALSGNASTASQLQTTRTIALSGDVTGSTTFNGSGNATISTTIAANSVALGTDTTGNYVATITGTTNEIEVSGSGSENAGVTIGLPNDVTIGQDLSVTRNISMSGDNFYFDGTTTYLRSDQQFFFLTDGGAAQRGSFKGLQVSTSYSGTPPDNGILFGTDTTLYRSAANTLSTGTGDSVLIPSGQLAVGTSTVSGVIHAHRTTNGSNLVLSNPTATSYAQIHFDTGSVDAFIFKNNSSYTSYGGANSLNIYNGTGGAIAFHPGALTNAVYMTTGGYVGIGTSSPSSPIHIVDNSSISLTVESSNNVARAQIKSSSGTATYSYLQLLTNGQGSGYLIKNVANSGNGLGNGSLYLWNDGGTNDTIEFVPNATIANRTTISENGNLTARGDVYVGDVTSSTPLTSGSQHKLKMGQEYWSGTKGTDGSIKLELYSTGTSDTYGLGVSSSELEIQSQSDIGFYAGGGSTRTKRMHIEGSNGNVGIGTSSPSYKLHVDHGSDTYSSFLDGEVVLRSNSPGSWNDGLNILDNNANGWAGITFHRGGSINGATTNKYWTGLRSGTSNYIMFGAPFSGIQSASSISAPRDDVIFEHKAGTTGYPFEFYVPVNFGQEVGIGTTSPTTLLNVNVGAGGSNGTAGIKIGGTSNYDSLELGIFGAYGGMIRSYGNDIHYFSGHWKTIGSSATEDHSHYWYTSKSGSTDWSTAKMELDHNGNLGIGTTSPSTKLHVNGTSALTGGKEPSIGNYGGDPAAVIGGFESTGNHDGSNENADTALIVVSKGNNGGNSPVMRRNQIWLTGGVSGEAYNSGAQWQLGRWTNSGTDARSKLVLSLADDAQTWDHAMTWMAYGSGTTMAVIGQDSYSYTSGDNTRLVGSYTTNKLHVNGSIQLTNNNDALVIGRGTATFLTDEELGFGWGGGWYMTEGTYLRVRNNKSVYSTGDARFSLFYDSNNTSYYANPAGSSAFAGPFNILGANAPAAHAYLNIGYSGTGETRAIDIDGSWSGGESKSITFTHGSTSSQIVGQINCQHNGPGSRLRWGKLYHSGDSGTYTMQLVSTSTTAADLSVSGNITASANVTAYSDERLKDNVEVIPHALDKVKEIRGVTYNRNDLDDTPRHTGVIAQEVEKVLPEVVSENEHGLKQVAYGNMVGLLIEAMKEQQEIIDKLQARVEALENN